MSVSLPTRRAAVLLAACLAVSTVLIPRVARAAAPVGLDWSATATSLRGQNGLRFTFVCPADGVANNLWGSDTYTDESSVCTAAVHTGVLDPTMGGIVTIEIRPGLDAYTGSTRYGVTSKEYGAWAGSFIVVAEEAGDARIGGGGWSATATAYAGNMGVRYQYICPPGGDARNVWGTTTYTTDSSVCTAAVHTGLITFTQGGAVTIGISSGLSEYVGSTRNGVTTNGYGAWTASFTFSATAAGATATATATGQETATATATDQETATPTYTGEPSATPSPTASATPSPTAAPAPTVEAPVVATATNTIDPTSAGTISLDTTLPAQISEGQTLPAITQRFDLLIPTGAVDQQTVFTAGVVAPRAVPQAIGQPGQAANVGVGAAYILRARGTATGTAVTQFGRPLVLQLGYDPAEIASERLTAGDLTIAYYAPPASPGAVGSWVSIPTTAVHGAALLTAQLSHFTLFQVRATARTAAQVAAAQARLAARGAAGPPRVLVLPAARVVGGVPVIVTLPGGSLASPPVISVIAAPASAISVTLRWATGSLTQQATANTRGLAALAFGLPSSFPKVATRVGVSVRVRAGGESGLISGSFVLGSATPALSGRATLSAPRVRSGQRFVVTVDAAPGLPVAIDVVGPARRLLASQHGHATGGRYVATLRLTVGPRDPASQTLRVVVTIGSGARATHQTLALILLRR